MKSKKFNEFPTYLDSRTQKVCFEFHRRIFENDTKPWDENKAIQPSSNLKFLLSKSFNPKKVAVMASQYILIESTLKSKGIVVHINNRKALLIIFS